MASQEFTLTEIEMLRHQLVGAEMRAAGAELRLQMTQRDALLEKIDPEGKLAKMDESLRKLRSAFDEAATGVMKFTIEVKTRLGLTGDKIYISPDGKITIDDSDVKNNT